MVYALRIHKVYPDGGTYGYYRFMVEKYEYNYTGKEMWSLMVANRPCAFEVGIMYELPAQQKYYNDTASFIISKYKKQKIDLIGDVSIVFDEGDGWNKKSFDIVANIIKSDLIKAGCKDYNFNY